MTVKHCELVRLEHAQLEILLRHQRLILLKFHHEFLDLTVDSEELLTALGLLTKVFTLFFDSLRDLLEGGGVVQTGQIDQGVLLRSY